MARRNDHSPEQLRALTLTTVTAFLEQQPAADLSLRQAAKLVGYSAGTLINLFGSYSYLLLALNGHTMDEMSGDLSAAMDQASTAKDKLRAMAEQYLAFAQQHPHRWRLVFEHRLAEGETLPDWQQQRIDRLLALVEECMLPLYPDASTTEIQLKIRTVWASVHGIVHLTLEDKLFATPAISGKALIDDLLTRYLPA
ncbi:TetR/AcrR family transcriptional regulator [Corallincola holothuriorum]|uniref:TetR/AcrR family transcriptional regulator n=1 Tax=Corallincola holothuriorum TaxID=2282215 RepID=A0A368NLI4_9GAMM|nr:TetR/AcrR family transcriptional regulator [Corallincola holothuriorum]RCU51457.1 TetR/AcrR family transcriptional regulator [Corallincola holothuriorum]